MKAIIPSDYSAGLEILQRILDDAEQHGFEEQCLFAIKIAVEEAIVNAIKHGNKLDPNKRVHIEAAITPKQAEICIEDEGPGFDRSSVPDPLAAEIRSHTNDRSPDRRLRIGYVSPDFRWHPVARFILPLFRERDRRQVEVFAYSDVTTPDAVTGSVREHVDRWRDVAMLPDEKLAEVVRADGIDILVDLAAHSGHNRLLAFARKPAPVQVTYLAYCSTTGVDAIDYRLTDRFLDPPSEHGDYTETSIHLPHCYWCYLAPPLPDSPRPATERRTGPPTFGCLNNFAKVTDLTLDLWARLLLRVSEARLLVYARAEAHRDRVRRVLRDAGVEESRAAFVGRQPFADYLDTYRLIDVGLDPHPYGGGTTTCDALWMGVPVVSLAGRTGVSRAGSTLLANVGLERLVARTAEQYVELAAGLIRDAPGLTALRRELRARLESSPVMNAPQFARDVEAAFRTAWRDWCASRAVVRPIDHDELCRHRAGGGKATERTVERIGPVPGRNYGRDRQRSRENPAPH